MFVPAAIHDLFGDLSHRCAAERIPRRGFAYAQTRASRTCKVGMQIYALIEI